MELLASYASSDEEERGEHQISFEMLLISSQTDHL